MGKRKKFEERESFMVTFEGWEANDLRVEADQRRLAVSELIWKIVHRALSKRADLPDEPRRYSEFWPEE